MYTMYMPRVSKWPVEENIQGELSDNFVYLVSSLHSSKDIEQFLNAFLTEEEKMMMAKRLMLHLMLENKYDASQIAAILNVSRETIRNHKIVWLTGGKTYKSIIAKLAKREKTKQLWRKVERILKPLDLMLHSRSNMKARAKLLSGDY
jgi:uncharacterized protein YerC